MWRLRDGIIRQEYAKCTYQEGDIVRPDKDESFKEHGYMRVRGFTKTYREWPKGEEFPATPKKPMIVLAECLDKPLAFNCTAQYLRKATPEELDVIDMKLICEGKKKVNGITENKETNDSEKA